MAIGEAAFGPGQGTVWLDEVSCRGRESRLMQCRHRPWGNTKCQHSEDAGVVCSTGKRQVQHLSC